MQRFCLESSKLLFIQIALIDDRLVDILVEPAGIHHIVTLLAALIAPAVLDLPAVRRAVFVEIDARDHHSVAHGGLADVEAVFFRHGEVNAERSVKVEDCVAPDAHLALTHESYIRTEPDDLAVFQLLHDQILQILHRKVQICDGRCAGDVAQIVDRAVLIERLVLCRGVDDADVIGSQVEANVLLIEGVGRELSVNVIYLVFVGVLEVEFLWRLAEAHGGSPKHMVRRR